MRRVESLAITAQDIRFNRLDDFFALSTASHSEWEYTAAWIDCLAKGESMGRGIFSRARHASGDAAAPPAVEPRLAIPFTPPISVISGLSVRAFNAVRWRRAVYKPHPRTEKLRRRLYPLDSIAGWNRLYGPFGFFQFQSVLPPREARDALGAMLREIAGSGEGSILAVLKEFGTSPPRAAIISDDGNDLRA